MDFCTYNKHSCILGMQFYFDWNASQKAIKFESHSIHVKTNECKNIKCIHVYNARNLYDAGTQSKAVTYAYNSSALPMLLWT